jgi:carboxypeptidase Q
MNTSTGFPSPSPQASPLGRRRNIRRAWCFLLLIAWPASTLPAAEAAPARAPSIDDAVARIKDEGLNRSQAMETLTWLTDVIGPRLTGSPQLKQANVWTRDKMVSWGLTNARLEGFYFGRGWSLKRFSAQVVEPQCFPLAAWPKAWCGGLDWPVVAEVVHLTNATDMDLEKLKGTLAGKIVMVSPAREVKPRFDPLATRLQDSNLLALANAAPRANSEGRRNFPPAAVDQPSRRGSISSTNALSAKPSTNPPPARVPRNIGPTERFVFAAREKAAVIVSCSGVGDGGTLFLGSATPGPTEADATNRFALFSRSPYGTNTPPPPPQVVLGAEDYNRLARMIERGVKPRMAVDLAVAFQDADLQAYNTVAEIPGGKLPKEVVMLGGHLDSWHVGTGATDDAVGVAAAMEAARIIQSLHLKPDRTIRVGLWAGEEQGLLGSRAYVNAHFGYYTNTTNPPVLRSPKDASQQPRVLRSTNAAPTRKLVRLREYDGFSAYFNLDNGAGRIRGIHLQNNEALRPLFRDWLRPFRDLGAETITIQNTGGTDHLSFDAIGLPGFQFIQDPIEYWTRTHHSNADTLDRVPPEDLKQAATIMAVFAYRAAMLEEKLARKPVE